MTTRLELDDLLPLLSGAKQYSNYVSAVCAFHDDRSPSMLVFNDGWFQCLACDARGTWDKLYAKLNGAPSIYVPKEHTEWKAPSLPKDRELLEALAMECHYSLTEREHLGWYWRLRGVDSLIEPCLLGWYNGWYTIPVFDRDHKFQRLVLRAGAHIQRQSGMRYYNSIGEPILYVPDWHRFLSHHTIVVVYGMIDALAVAELGIPVCTVTAGKGQFNGEWIRQARGDKGMPGVHIVPDMGEEETAIKLAKTLQPYARIVQLPYTEDECEDPADYLSSGKRDLLLRRLA